MRTKLLMSLSALLLGALGVGASFLPHEILAFLGANPGRTGVLLVQVLGAAYLGFAMLNWMNRGNLMGGIYNRPAALGNFLHFVVVTITLLKALPGGGPGALTIAATTVYAIFACWFGLVLWTDPHGVKKAEG